ncbi:MAG TPA: hypothetical protein DE312_01235 [Gallionella sp.]|jgi:signal transduction histidine kinase/HAMP domain-containing protein|nr:ATP-binding protein [Gallionella sp.]OGS67165.1 MAG: hypothetical protein A2Z87_02925 [Gallionellales bacterium GWA2_54_124]OGT20492.1 MAG: hypothetical protein A2522_10745 [Gallionellales bacterium RIFOXYD12_FULL_53_10]HCI51948.1 hypothetical protein [Gallionella sp.]
MKLTLSTKLVAPWLLFILFSCIGLYAHINYTSRIEREINAHNHQHQRAAEISKEILLHTQERWVIVLEHLARPGIASTSRIIQSGIEIETLSKELESLFETVNLVGIHAGSDQDREVLTNFLTTRTGLTELYLNLIAAIDAKDLTRQSRAIEQVARKMHLVQASLDDLMQYHIASREVALDHSRKMAREASLLFYQAIGVLLLLLLAFTIYQAFDIVQPLQNLANTVTRFNIEKDTLALIPERSRDDEIGGVARSFENMDAQIRKYIKELSERQTVILEQMGMMSKVGGWELDLTDMRLSWTKETYRIHEIDPSVQPDLTNAINFYAPESRPVIQSAIDKAMQDGTPWDLELPFITAKGNHIWVRALGEATRLDGKVVRLNGAFQDITEQKKLLESIRQANADLEGFSYSVSHDLRTPLRAIDGFSRILLEDYNDQLDAEGKRLLNVVRSNTQRMSQLIDDILHFSRAGRTALTYSEIDMNELVHQVLEELKSSMDGRNLTLNIATLPVVNGDHAMLHQVIENLLTNAIKFTGSMVEPRIEIGCKHEDATTTFFVRDNGVGFDMQYVDKLFGVFQRLHGVTEFEGTGIGLAIAKRVINRHGGQIWAEAELNKGATFYFSLPNKESNDEQRK